METELSVIEKVISEGPYTDSWESLSKHPIPEWYRKAKLGIFIHWGVYSVPAYSNEWYPRHMYYRAHPVYKHHLKTYGKNFEYHDFIPMFKAEKFDADNWLGMLKDCGAGFVMPVAEHHDGFKMYASGLNRWNAALMGPQRDILGEIKQAAEKVGVRFAASSHRAEHYWFMNGGATLPRPNATRQEELSDFYGPCFTKEKVNSIVGLLMRGHNIVPSREWLENWLISSCEIVDKYMPSCSYFDFWTAEESFRPYMRKFLAYYYNRAAERGVEVVSFYKNDAALYPCGVYVQERGQKEGMSAEIWQCETSTSYNSWSYCTTNKFKTAAEIIRNMIDVWSKNGCMALNIGPKSDGTICPQETAILKDVAQWTQKNREAIWGAGVFRVFGEGKKQKSGAFNEHYKYTAKDYRFTYKVGALYAFAMKPAGKTKFRLYSLAPSGASNAIVKSVSVLGEDIKAEFKKCGRYHEISIDKPVGGELPIVFKIILE